MNTIKITNSYLVLCIFYDNVSQFGVYEKTNGYFYYSLHNCCTLISLFFVAGPCVSHSYRLHICFWRNVCKDMASVQDFYKQASQA